MVNEFLIRYAKWIAAGAQQQFPFDRSVGLCTNIRRHYGAVAEGQLKHQLAAEFGDSMYPFNNGNPRDYTVEQMDKTMHLNKRRTEYVLRKCRAS